MSDHNTVMVNQVTPRGATEKTVLRDDNGYALIVFGTDKPADAATGYATGCLFLHTDGGDNTALYVNEGTASSADFNAVSAA